MSKTSELIPKIKEAKTNEDALAIMHGLLEALHLTNNYTDLVKLKTKFDESKSEYEKIINEYKNSEKDMEVLLNTRSTLNFFYIDVFSNFSFEINKNKIYWEEHKTVTRAKAMERLKDNEEFQKVFKTKSTSGIRDVMGYDEGYQEFVAIYSMSYGFYKELESYLTSIRMMIDYLASAIKNEQIILQKDAK